MKPAMPPIVFHVRRSAREEVLGVLVEVLRPDDGGLEDAGAPEPVATSASVPDRESPAIATDPLDHGWFESQTMTSVWS